MPTHTRSPSPTKVQVRGSRHLLLSTPWLQQGCDSPPYTGKQWPTLLSSVWPDGGALHVRVRISTRGTTRDRPCCVVRSLLFTDSCCEEGPEQPYILQTDLFSPTVTSPTCSEQLCLTQVTQESYQHKKGQAGQATVTTHPGMISTTRGLPTSHFNWLLLGKSALFPSRQPDLAQGTRT